MMYCAVLRARWCIACMLGLPLVLSMHESASYCAQCVCLSLSFCSVSCMPDPGVSEKAKDKNSPAHDSQYTAVFCVRNSEECVKPSIVVASEFILPRALVLCELLE